MRRFLLGGIVSLLALSACGKGMSSVEVMQKAAAVSQNLQSVHFEASADLTGTGVTTSHVQLSNGTLQDGGAEMRFLLSASGEDSAHPSFVADVITGRDGTYIFPKTVAFPSNPSLGSLMDGWWKLPGGSDEKNAGVITPDPRILRAQLEAVNITADRGMETIGGRKMYHFDVAVNPEKLLRAIELRSAEGGAEMSGSGAVKFQGAHASGEVWIDAKDFSTDRILWTILLPGAARTLSVNIAFSDQNAASFITPPEHWTPLSPEACAAGIRALYSCLSLPSLPDASDVESGAIFFLE